MMKLPLTLIIIISLCGLSEPGMMGWLFASDPPGSAKPAITAADGADGSRLVPFEVDSADEKFLASVKTLTSVELSELDMCQHKIFLSLKRSCSQLTEEEMAKVSVQLLNCQSQAEGRPVFTCTEDMSIGGCTRHMDANTWNAYHIVSNRARAVCYAARQQQFRASTELAVNRLAAHTYRQIEDMKHLEGSQKNLEKMTQDTMQTVARGQQDLLQQHDQIKLAQTSIQSHVVDNLRELSRVRSAISIGQVGVSHTLEQIRSGLEQAGEQLGRHEAARNRSHQQLTEDLERIRSSAVQLLDRLESVDDTTQAVVARFDELLQSLSRMNSTIFSLLSTLETTQHQVDEKLGWLVQLLGSDLHLVTGVLLHIGYLLLGMLLLAFLSAPYVVRLSLLLLVPLNMVSLLQHGPTMEFSSVTTALVTIMAVHYIAVWLSGWYRSGGSAQPFTTPLPVRGPSLKSEPSEKSLNGSVMEPADLARAPTHDAHSSDSDGEGGALSASYRPEPAVSRPLRRAPLLREMGRASPLRQRMLPPATDWDAVPPVWPLSPAAHNASLNGSARLDRIRPSPNITERPWCAAICRNGQQCRNTSGYTSPYCGVHARGSRESTPLS